VLFGYQTNELKMTNLTISIFFDEPIDNQPNSAVFPHSCRGYSQPGTNNICLAPGQ
jgi:hypothetical protein